MEWIDAHVHVWTPDSERYPRGESYPIPERIDAVNLRIEPDDFSPEVLLGHARPSGVSRVVLIQMSFYNTDNRYMLDSIKAYPDVFRGVAFVDHESGRVADEMADLLQQGVTGFRIIPEPGTADRWLQSRGYDAMWRAAGENGQAICPLLNPDALAEVDRMCGRFPGTTVVVDHLGRIGADGIIREGDVDALCSLASHQNVYVKVSAFYALGRKAPPHDDLVPIIRRVYDAYGPERLMWASDCPFQVLNESYEDSIALVRARLDFLSTDDRNWMLGGTAEKVFFAQ